MPIRASDASWRDHWRITVMCHSQLRNMLFHNPMLRTATLLALALAATAVATAPAAAAEWGTIRGKFVYKGEPKNEPVNVTKDVEYCGPKKPTMETVVVGEGGGLQNVFVYLYVARGKKVAVHPDYKPGDPKVLTNLGCRFAPHAMAVWTAEEFEVHNDDEGVGHNTNFNLAVNQDFNLTVSSEAPIKRKFDKSEPVPAGVSCNIHPWMTAMVLVRDNPYAAVTGEDGSFEIKNVPAGDQELVLFHEANGYLRGLKVGTAKADRKGQIKVKVPPAGELDLGVIEVTPIMLGQ
ncbi:MAG TPA: hypothetical protein VEQ85_02835 [Lacipirellulaceae bacterium]|nr:hypothetical protein [Lacipirellulaceae bacterium]